MRHPRILDAEAAAALVRSGQTIIVEGSSGFGVAEAVLAALERRFLASGEPRDLILAHTTGVGDRATRGINHLAREGMLRRVIGGNWAWRLEPGQLSAEHAARLRAAAVASGRA